MVAPVWERGLKSSSVPPICGDHVAPVWERGLKYFSFYNLSKPFLVAPVWERGLKFSDPTV